LAGSGTADFFLFRRVKEALVGTTLDKDSLKTAWEGVIQRWFKRAEKCVRIGGDFVKKS
jgi:hypothetical protein